MMKIVLLAAFVAGIAAKSVKLPTNNFNKFFNPPVTGQAPKLLDISSACKSDGNKCDQDKAVELVKDYFKCLTDNAAGRDKCTAKDNKVDCADADCKKYIKCSIDFYCAAAKCTDNPAACSKAMEEEWAKIMESNCDAKCPQDFTIIIVIVVVVLLLVAVGVYCYCRKKKAAAAGGDGK